MTRRNRMSTGISRTNLTGERIRVHRSHHPRLRPVLLHLAGFLGQILPAMPVNCVKIVQAVASCTKLISHGVAHSSIALHWCYKGMSLFPHPPRGRSNVLSSTCCCRSNRAAAAGFPITSLDPFTHIYFL